MEWQNTSSLSSLKYKCGYCNYVVASTVGYYSKSRTGADRHVYICPNCQKPTYWDYNSLVPSPIPGSDVTHLPQEVAGLYLEARRCMAVEAYTASVMASRKLLMNIAVSKGASLDKSFLDYVQFLATKGFVPPDGTGWVDHIRKKGNEANHEIKLMGKSDAEDLVQFSEMLLRFVFEFPNRIPKPPAA